MSKLLDDNIITNTAPQPPSKEQVSERVQRRIQNLSRESFNQMINTQREGIDIVWNHPILTPQEVIDALGENAIKVFMFHRGLTDYILGVAAADNIQVDVKYPTNAVVIDPTTGKITVTEDPYTP
jgi:hypothetical protein